ncbi:universal stress protein [Hymenobacter chitinivorans]|uniref:Nucleotide-binding universal stress UspA family protein n=1 Tax=Hymenobacter chitinivorans DSM 11115 TaxID=1121954 RepID=A0A2M9BMU2_9BACT|nr:universal stress protein [Hymenobacter chitinivorans]PJJ59283.1 nucleotide-binding universal stress UspA family protein [Hymenobacter chitinivorans DSM 11115]
MKNILVPTDFSPAAHHAFEVAMRLAQRTSGGVTLLHVEEHNDTPRFSSSGGRIGGSSLGDVFMLKYLQKIKHQMHELMAEGQQLAPDVPVTELLRTSSLVDSVLEVVAERGIDLVVMGAQEQSSWQHFFAGSNTEQLVRRVPCPVLTVKHPEMQFNVQHIVFPSDFSAEADRAVPDLQRIQAVFPDATLHLLKVVPDIDQYSEALDRIQAFAERHHLAHCEAEVIDAANAGVGIPLFAQQAHADLVVMPTHAHTGLSHLWHHNVAENVARHAAPPVLMFRL